MSERANERKWLQPPTSTNYPTQFVWLAWFSRRRLEELGDLNDDEVEELLENLVGHNVKLAHRQKLRRGLHSAHDENMKIEMDIPDILQSLKKRRNSNGSNNGSQSSGGGGGEGNSNGGEGSGGSRRGSRGALSDGSGDQLHNNNDSNCNNNSNNNNNNNNNNSVQPQQMSIEFLLENFFNFNSAMSMFPTMKLLQNSLHLRRAITILDRTPPIQTHKVALLFNGAGSKVFSEDMEVSERMSGPFGRREYEPTTKLTLFSKNFARSPPPDPLKMRIASLGAAFL